MSTQPVSQSDQFSALQGVLHIQPDGPGHPTYPVKCVEVGEVTVSQGDVAIEYCGNIHKLASYQIGVVESEPPDLPSMSITVPAGATADALRKVVRRGGWVPFYIVKNHRTPKERLMNYDRVQVCGYCRVTQKTKSDWVAPSSARSMESFEMTMLSAPEIWKLSMARRVTAETQTMTFIAGRDMARTQGPQGGALEAGDLLMAGTTAVALGTANVLFSNNYGIAWAAGLTDPFAASEDISCGIFVQKEPDVWRAIVGRGTTDAGNPAEIAYSDDTGATWNTVDVGSDVGEFLPWNTCLYAIDFEHVWCCTEQGAIYFSNNGGETWTLQPTGSADALNSLYFVNEKVGVAAGGTTAASSEVLYTLDGGISWVQALDFTPKAATMINGIVALDDQRWVVVLEDGDIFKTENAGVSWFELERPLFLGEAGAIANSLIMVDDFTYFVAMSWETAVADFGAIMRTFDGGEHWEQFSSLALDAADIGIRSVWAAHHNQAWGVGGAETTSWIMELNY